MSHRETVSCGVVWSALTIALATPLAAARPVLPAEVPIRTIASADGTISYRDSGGSGRPILFLNRGSSNLWDPQIAAVTRAGFRFVAIEFRASSELMRRGQPSIDRVADELGLTKFDLVGASTGAVLAMQYALAHPARIRSLMVGNSLMGLRDASFNALEKRLRSITFDAQPREARELGPTYRALDPEGTSRWIALTEPPVQGAAAPGSMAGGPLSSDVVTWSRLDGANLRVLLFTGDADLYTPPGILRAFAQRFRRAQLLIVPDSGHASNWENPEVFNNALLSFVRRQ